MAGYRQFHTKFWKDEWVIELDPLERYLFSYLFTNDLSSISGIYKLPLRVVINETGLEKEFIVSSFAKFQRAKKIFYEEGVMWVVNMHRFHKNASPRTMAKVQADVRDIPDGRVKTAYLYHEKTGEYSIDTVSIPRSESVSVSVSVSESVSVSVKGDEDPPPLIDPSLQAFHEVTGFYPTFADEDRVKQYVTDIRAKHKNPPIDRLLEIMTDKYDLWKSCTTTGGKPYNPSRIDWLEWCVTGYVPNEKRQPVTAESLGYTRAGD